MVCIMAMSVGSGGRSRSSGRLRPPSVRFTRVVAITPAAPAPTTSSFGRALRSRGGGKRRFRGFAVSDPFSEADPGGEDGPGLELSITAFSLSQKKQALGMDECRKRTMRRLLWYWQFSRDWNWRAVSHVERVQQDFCALNSPVTVSYASRAQAGSGQWYWRWHRRLMGRKLLKQPRALMRAKLLREKLLADTNRENAYKSKGYTHSE